MIQDFFVISGVSMIEGGAMEFILCRLDPRYSVRDKHVSPVDALHTDIGDMESDGKDYYKIIGAMGDLMWLFLDAIVVCQVACNVPTQKALM